MVHIISIASNLKGIEGIVAWGHREVPTGKRRAKYVQVCAASVAVHPVSSNLGDESQKEEERCHLR